MRYMDMKNRVAGVEKLREKKKGSWENRGGEAGQTAGSTGACEQGNNDNEICWTKIGKC